jgi:hypothetical protein
MVILYVYILNYDNSKRIELFIFFFIYNIMSKTLLIILILIITTISLWNQFKDKYYQQEVRDIQPIQPPYILPQTVPSLLPSISPLREYDYRNLNDTLVAPKKRDDYTIPVIPIPTRGWPSAYSKKGTLIDHKADNSDPYKFLFLIGRQKYPSSDWYDYYVTETNSDGRLKFDVHHTHKELFSGDKITIPELNKTYECHIDHNFNYEYNPYII